MNIKFGKPINSNEIVKFEKLYNTSLPNDYKKFLLKQNGCIPEKESFRGINGIDYTVEKFLPLLGDVSVSHNKDERFPKHIIPIAFMLGGNILLMSLNNNDYGSVYYWMHENEDGENIDMKKVFDSFSDLLSGLYHDPFYD